VATAGDKPAASSGPSTASDGPKSEAAPASSRKPSAAQSDSDRSSGAKTGINTDAAQAEYAAAGQNPALDNRLGDQRPGARGFKAKPQQFPGPEVGHFAEHAEQYGDAFRKEFDVDDDAGDERLGGGPHGREPRGDGTGPSSAGADGEPGSDV